MKYTTEQYEFSFENINTKKEKQKTMKYIEAPNYDEITDDQSLFLAGGITGVENWQQHAIDRLKIINNITILNPRRKNFEAFKNDSGFKESETQIKWEFTYINKAKQVMFWFSHETLQPIALLELACRLVDNNFRTYTGQQEIFIGIHSEYQRKFDLFVQIPLISHGRFKLEKICNSLDKLLDQIIIYNKNMDRYLEATKHIRPIGVV
jgi:hypothetical protein